MMIEVGQPAPDFTLLDTVRKPRSLSEFRGKKVVLAFFCGAFTTVCTKELCTVMDNIEKLSALGAQVAAVSVDSPFANRAFAEKNGLAFPLLSDFTRDVVNRYGIPLSNFAGMQGYVAAKRSVFILDEEGVVRYKWVSDDPAVEPNYQELAAALEKIP